MVRCLQSCSSPREHLSYTLSPREKNKMLLTFALEELVKGLPPLQHLSGGVSGKDKRM